MYIITCREEEIEREIYTTNLDGMYTLYTHTNKKMKYNFLCILLSYFFLLEYHNIQLD